MGRIFFPPQIELVVVVRLGLTSSLRETVARIEIRGGRVEVLDSSAGSAAAAVIAAAAAAAATVMYVG